MCLRLFVFCLSLFVFVVANLQTGSQTYLQTNLQTDLQTFISVFCLLIIFRFSILFYSVNMLLLHLERSHLLINIMINSISSLFGTKMVKAFVGEAYKEVAKRSGFYYSMPALLEPKLDGLAKDVGIISNDIGELFGGCQIVDDVERVSKEIALKRRICGIVQGLRDELENTRKVFDVYPYMFFEGLSPTKVKKWNEEFSLSFDRVKRLRADIAKSRSEGMQRSRARVERDAARTLDDVFLALFDEAKRTDEEYRKAESMLDSLNAVMLDYCVEDFLLLLEVLVGAYSRCIDDAVHLEGDVRARFGFFYKICLKFEMDSVEELLKEFKENEMEKYGYFSQDGIRAYLARLKSTLSANDIWKIRQECPDDEEFFRRIYKSVSKEQYISYKKLSWEYSYLTELQQKGAENRVVIPAEKTSVFASDEAKEMALNLAKKVADFVKLNKRGRDYALAVLLVKYYNEGLLLENDFEKLNVDGIMGEIGCLFTDKKTRFPHVSSHVSLLKNLNLNIYEEAFDCLDEKRKERYSADRNRVEKMEKTKSRLEDYFEMCGKECVSMPFKCLAVAEGF